MKNEDMPEYIEIPEYNETDHYGIDQSGSREFNEIGVEDVALDDEQDQIAKKRRKTLLSQIMAFTTTTVIAVSTVAIFPITANTKIKEISSSEAVITTNFNVIGDKTGENILYNLYDNENLQIVETGETNVKGKMLEFNNLMPGKSYKLVMYYKGKVIKTFVFNTSVETDVSEKKETQPETVPETVPETIPETEVETEAETETETEVETETETETEVETETEQETVSETRNAVLLTPEKVEIDDEIHVIQIQEGSLDYSNAEQVKAYKEKNTYGEPSSTAVLPIPDYMKCSYGSSEYPFYPILEKIEWKMPPEDQDAKMYLEWAVTTKDDFSQTEVHTSEVKTGSFEMTDVAADIKEMIGNSERFVAFTPCYVCHGNLVKLHRQLVPLPYLKVNIDFSMEENGKISLEGLDSLEECGLTMTYSGRRIEKYTKDVWVNAEADFSSGKFEHNVIYRVTYEGIEITSKKYNTVISIGDRSGERYHE